MMSYLVSNTSAENYHASITAGGHCFVFTVRRDNASAVSTVLYCYIVNVLTSSLTLLLFLLWPPYIIGQAIIFLQCGLFWGLGDL